MDINLLNPAIIFEDHDILIIDKPPGVTVNKSETSKNEQTIQEWSENKLHQEMAEEKDTDFAKRGGIVHRLDKETSGILVIAKNNRSFLSLQAEFKERKVIKKYLTLVHGVPDQSTGTINAPIDRLPWNRMHFGVFPGGRESVTDYKTMGIYCASSPVGTHCNVSLQNNEKLALIEVTPHTGRTHQIRVHFKYLNHPVVGDELYAGRKTGRDDRKFCPRQFLHACHLEIFHPVTNKRMIFDSPLPDDLQKVLDSLIIQSADKH